MANSAMPAAPSAITPDTHRIPGCDGHWHHEGLCEAELDSLPLADGDLIVTAHATTGTPAELVVWQDMRGDLIRTCDAVKAVAFADRLRALAAAVDKGAALLSAPAATAEPVDYAARFAALDEYQLFAIEGDTEDCTAAAGFVESLLSVLADWRPRIVTLLDSAPAWAVPEVAAYEQAVNRTQEAWLLYSFRYQGGPALPGTFGLPAPRGHAQTVTPAARIVSAGRRSLTVREVAA
jgi:hypothetical protein